MEDHRWKESAEEWQSAYQKIKKNFDTLYAKVMIIRVAASNLQRGCDCEHDYRCGRCEAVIRIKDLLESIVTQEVKDQ